MAENSQEEQSNKTSHQVSSWLLRWLDPPVLIVLVSFVSLASIVYERQVNNILAVKELRADVDSIKISYVQISKDLQRTENMLQLYIELYRQPGNRDRQQRGDLGWQEPLFRPITNGCTDLRAPWLDHQQGETHGEDHARRPPGHDAYPLR